MDVQKKNSKNDPICENARKKGSFFRLTYCFAIPMGHGDVHVPWFWYEVHEIIFVFGLMAPLVQSHPLGEPQFL